LRLSVISKLRDDSMSQWIIHEKGVLFTLIGSEVIKGEEALRITLIPNKTSTELNYI
jgi:hypothetical protein